jgi:hypothetical protein
VIGPGHCQWCGADEGPLTSIGVVGLTGPGWDYYACRPCLIERRSIPLEWHPPGTRGAPRTYPKIVPLPVIVKLAALLDRAPELRPDLTPVIGRLLEAADVLGDRQATADDRAAADEDARNAVAELRACAAHGGLRAVPTAAGDGKAVRS